MKVESRVIAIAAALASGSIAHYREGRRRSQGVATHGSLSLPTPTGTSAPAHRRRSDRSSGRRGAPEPGPVPVLIGNAMAIQSQLDRTTRGAAKSTEPHNDLTEKRGDRMLPVILHVPNTSAAWTIRPESPWVLA